MSAPDLERTRGAALLADVGGVIAAWIGLFAIENLVVAIVWREQFAGSWEMGHARYYLTPIALAAVAPLALVTVLVGRLVAERRARVVAALAGSAAVALALGVSEGRHMAGLAVRAPFVVVAGVVAASVASLAVRRAPLDRPRTLAALGASAAALAWCADAMVLTALYPAFHAALLGITLERGRRRPCPCATSARGGASPSWPSPSPSWPSDGRRTHPEPWSATTT